MTRQQQYLRINKELRFNALSLAKRIRSKRICFECSTRVNIQKETGEPVIFRFVKHVFPGNPWIEINRIEKPHSCNEIDVCYFTPKRKIELLLR